MRVYIVWVKGKKVTFKILQAESFAGISQDGLSREVLAKCSPTLNSLASSMCFSCDFFTRTFTHELLASREIALIFIACFILHQLNTKPNIIKSQKIQGTKLMKLQHFLSWNKVNIKHSCKSQLYRRDWAQWIHHLWLKLLKVSWMQENCKRKTMVIFLNDFAQVFFGFICFSF